MYLVAIADTPGSQLACRRGCTDVNGPTPYHRVCHGLFVEEIQAMFTPGEAGVVQICHTVLAAGMAALFPLSPYRT